jgi:DNA polymerase-3 subunit delta'
MPWDEIAGQARAVRLIQRALGRGQLHHAYLLTGLDGVGKELFARLCAQAANCEESDFALRPCGKCSACTGILRGNFPDVFWVRPQSELVKRGLVNKGDLEHAPSREIRVDEVRQLARRLAFSLVRGQRKVAILSPADALNERAQNALLKTLEEPPPQTTFFLITSKPDELLPTVRSRCARLMLAPLSAELIEAHLVKHGEPKEAAKLKALRADGSLARALELTTEEIDRRGELAAKLNTALTAPDERDALDLAEALADRDDAAELISVLRENARSTLVSNGHEARGAAQAPALLREHDLCDEVSAALEQNGNPRLQLERLLLGARTIRLRASPGAAASGAAHGR